MRCTRHIEDDKQAEGSIEGEKITKEAYGCFYSVEDKKELHKRKTRKRRRYTTPLRPPPPLPQFETCARSPLL